MRRASADHCAASVCFLFHRWFRLVFLLPQLLAGRLLVFLDDLLGDHIQERILSIGGAYEQQRHHRNEQVKTFHHDFLLSLSETLYFGFRIAVSLRIAKLLLSPGVASELAKTGRGCILEFGPIIPWPYRSGRLYEWLQAPRRLDRFYAGTRYSRFAALARGFLGRRKR